MLSIKLQLYFFGYNHLVIGYEIAPFLAFVLCTANERLVPPIQTPFLVTCNVPIQDMLWWGVKIKFLIDFIARMRYNLPCGIGWNLEISCYRIIELFSITKTLKNCEKKFFTNQDSRLSFIIMFKIYIPMLELFVNNIKRFYTLSHFLETTCTYIYVRFSVYLQLAI